MRREQARRLFTLSVAVASLLLAPCVLIQRSVGDDGSKEPNDWVPFTTFGKGWVSYYGYDDYYFDGEYLAIKNQTAWASFWFNHTKGSTPQPPVPTNISWDVEMVLVSLLGWWPDCCVARTNFTAAYMDGDTLYAYVENIYGHGWLCMITNPYHIIVVERADNVTFIGVYDGWDVYPPEGSIIIDNGNEWANSTSVTLTLTYYDYFSGVSVVRYSNDGVWDDEPWESPSPTRAWTLEDGDGTKTVYYQVMDNVGWVSDTYSDDISLDTAPPSVLITFPSEGQTFNIADVLVFGVASDDSEVDRVDVRLNGGSWRTATGNASWSLGMTLASGSNTIEARSVDLAFNPSPVAGVNVTYIPIHPGPPVVTDAFLSGKSLENITLVWLLSSDDGMGLGSVVKYEVLRGEIFSHDGSGYELTASLPNGTSSFVDVSRGEGDPEHYFYRVCAVDIDGNVSCGMSQGAKFTRSLSKGPNLVSIPLVPSDESIETVLQSVSFSSARHYDSFSQEWNSYMNDKTYKGELWNIDHTMGLWINVTEDSNLTLAGMVPAQTTIHLQKGWNLIAFPSFNASFTVADLKTAAPIERVEAFDPSNPPHFLRVALGTDVLLAGEGYWLRTTEDTFWRVSNT